MGVWSVDRRPWLYNPNILHSYFSHLLYISTHSQKNTLHTLTKTTLTTPPTQMSNYATEVEAILAAARARGGYEYEADQEEDVYDNDVDQTYDAHGPSMAGYASEDGEDEEEQDGEDQDGEYGSRYAHNEVLARALGVPGFGEGMIGIPLPACILL
jgi:beta-glucanase (GH16 family)